MGDPLTVSCPDCLARKGQPCVYLWPKNWDGTPKVVRSYHGAATRAQMDRAGQPMKRFHGGRYNKVHLKERVAQRKAREAAYAESHAISADREAILRANAQAMLDEQHQLIAWLTEHAHILTGAE